MSKKRVNGSTNGMKVIEVEYEGVCFRIGGKDVVVHDIVGTLRRVEMIRERYKGISADDPIYGGWMSEIAAMMTQISPGNEFCDTEVRAFHGALMREYMQFEESQKKMLDDTLKTVESPSGIPEPQPSQ